jgi:hypothetical protein
MTTQDTATLPDYLCYDHDLMSAARMGVEQGRFTVAELVAALPDASTPDRWTAMKRARAYLDQTGALRLYNVERTARYERMVRCPSWCEQGDHAQDRRDMSDYVNHSRRLATIEGEGDIELSSYEGYGPDDTAGPERPRLGIPGIEDGMFTLSPERVRDLASLLPPAADALTAAQAEWKAGGSAGLPPAASS